jgi:hypothetical protein
VVGRWVHKKCKRVVIIVADRSTHVDFHYVQAPSGFNMWRRGIKPLQTLSRDEFLKFFKEVA